jgi:hypothetical protein
MCGMLKSVVTAVKCEHLVTNQHSSDAADPWLGARIGLAHRGNLLHQALRRNFLVFREPRPTSLLSLPANIVLLQSPVKCTPA